MIAWTALASTAAIAAPGDAQPRAERTDKKVVLDVIVGDGLRRYGEPNPDFSIEFEGFLPGDSRAELTIPPMPAPTDGLFANPGEYEVRFVGGVDETYTFRLAEAGTLTVENAIQFDLDPGWNLLAAPFAVAAEETPFNLVDGDGDPISRAPLWTWQTQNKTDTYHRMTGGLRSGNGFWAYAPDAATTRWFTLDDPPPVEFELPAGWTLFGVPYNCRFNQLENFERIIVAWRWSAEEQTYEPIEPTTLLRRGQGYWLFLQQETTIRIPNASTAEF